MPLQQITADDIAGWDSLTDIASTFEKRGLKVRENLGDDNELVLQLSDNDFIVLVEAGPGESATEFKPDNINRHTNLVATNDFEEFTFLTRIRSWEGQQHGRVKHQKLSFSKSQFASESGEKHTILEKLNNIEYGSKTAITDSLYDTKKVVKEFYQQFENLRTDLVQEVANVPDDRGDAKQRYVQVTLDRMIFLYFIQEKRLLDRNKTYLHDHHEQKVEAGKDVWEAFYEPLFFEMLAEGRQDPEFGSLPYLNGGLFSRNPIEDEFQDARLGATPSETADLFARILDFLSSWNWNVDERLDIVDPKNLSPAILGHIFEQTVNQKEMGAYYTPEEITGFMARNSVHPYLLDQLNEQVDTTYSELDEVFGFSPLKADDGATALADGGAVTAQPPSDNVETRHVETLYHDILTDMHVLDPAVGSGAFLLAAQDVLLDIYIQCIEYFQHLDNSEQSWELGSETRDLLETLDDFRGSETLYSKRSIILNNLYGVDIDDGAVEICKLRLWLSMVADIEDEPTEVQPLPNIDFNIRQGNSLIGFTDIHESTSDGDGVLSNWDAGIGDSVEQKYEEVIEAVKKHRTATSGSEATNWRNVAESRLSQYESDLNEKILSEFRNAGLEDATLGEVQDVQPFHWVLEFAYVYADGGFDVVIGNPPWEQLQPSRDDFFPQYDPVFRTRMPDDKDAIQAELLEDSEIAADWEHHQNHMNRRAEYYKKSASYTLQSPSIDGRAVPSKRELSGLFLERIFSLTGDRGYVAQILPGRILNGTSAKELRMHLLNQTSIDYIIGFENKGIFDNIDDRYNFAVWVFNNSGSTDMLHGIFQQHSLGILRSIDDHVVRIPNELLTRFSPEVGIFPLVKSQMEVEVLQKLADQPAINKDVSNSWQLRPYFELNRTTDRDRYVEDESDGDYPVYGGSNINQFLYTPHKKEAQGIESAKLWSVDESQDPDTSAKRRIREKNVRTLKTAIYDAFDGTGSQKGFVNDLLNESRGKPLSPADVLLDCSEYRIVHRDIARSTDERTMIASVIPPGVVCHDKLHTMRPYRVSPTEEDLDEMPLHSAYEKEFTDAELFVAVGLLNSIPFDYLIRRKTDTTLIMYKVKESQLPRLTEGDDWFHYIAERAARLNCYGEEFAEMRERLGGIEPVTDNRNRRELQAEIDAAAFHTYGLERRDVEFVLDDFHRVSNPRLMTEDYFDMVFEKFDLLEQEGPPP